VLHQLGVKDETVYGTAVTVDTFFEPLPGDPIALETGRVESGSLRRGQVVMSADRFVPYRLGGSGSRSLEVLTHGFDWWLRHLLGAVDTEADTPVAGAEQHVGTLADLCGQSFTLQENVPMGACQDSDQAMTWAGGKVASWTLSCSTEGVLTLEVELLFSSLKTDTVLATASYPVGAELLSWASGRVQVDGAALPVTSWSVAVDNKLKSDRHRINGTGASPSFGRLEPITEEHRDIAVEFECDRTSLGLWQKFASATRAGALASFEVLTEGPAPITGSTYPSLAIEVPALRIDDVPLGSLGLEEPMQSVSGVGRDNGTDEPITVTYVTAAP
jgi:hypothetical protein